MVIILFHKRLQSTPTFSIDIIPLFSNKKKEEIEREPSAERLATIQKGLNSSQKGTSYHKARRTGFLKYSMVKSGMLVRGSGSSDCVLVSV